MVVRKKQEIKKGWFESFLDDTNIIEKLFFLVWFGVIGLFYVMFDMFNIWIRILLSVGLFTLLSTLIYGFAVFMNTGISLGLGW